MISGISLTAADAGGNSVGSAGFANGSHTIVWSGAATSPGGTGPSYPAENVSFTSGVSTTSLSTTLYDAGTNSLTATAGAISGTAAITVDAGAPDSIALASCLVNNVSTACASAFTTLGTNGTLKANVAFLDQWGNAAAALSNFTSIDLTSTTGASVAPTSLDVPLGSAQTAQFTVTHSSGTPAITVNPVDGNVLATLTFTVR